METTKFAEFIKGLKREAIDRKEERKQQNIIKDSEIRQAIANIFGNERVSVKIQSPYDIVMYRTPSNYQGFERACKIYSVNGLNLFVSTVLGTCLGEYKDGEKYPLVLVTPEMEDKYYDARIKAGERLVKNSHEGKAPEILLSSMVEDGYMPFYLDGPLVENTKDKNLETITSQCIVIQFPKIDLRRLNPKQKEILSRIRKKYNIGVQERNDGNDMPTESAIYYNPLSKIISHLNLVTKNSNDMLKRDNKIRAKEGKPILTCQRELLPLVLAKSVEEKKDLETGINSIYEASISLKEKVGIKPLKQAILSTMFI